MAANPPRKASGAHHQPTVKTSTTMMPMTMSPNTIRAAVAAPRVRNAVRTRRQQCIGIGAARGDCRADHVAV